MVEKGECILTHELHCTYIYTITYNPQLNVTHKLITHRFLITSLSSWIHSRKKELLAILSENTIGHGPVVQRSGKSRRLMWLCVRFIFARGLRERRQGDSGTEFEREKGGKVENSAGSFIRREYAHVWCMCLYPRGMCVYYGWKDFRMDLNYRWEHFVTESFQDSHSHLVRQLGISVCRIARHDSRSCVTILGQLRLLIASDSWKKTKKPDSELSEKFSIHNFLTRGQYIWAGGALRNNFFNVSYEIHCRLL